MIFLQVKLVVGDAQDVKTLPRTYQQYTSAFVVQK